MFHVQVCFKGADTEIRTAFGVLCAHVCASVQESDIVTHYEKRLVLLVDMDTNSYWFLCVSPQSAVDAFVNKDSSLPSSSIVWGFLKVDFGSLDSTGVTFLVPRKGASAAVCFGEPPNVNLGSYQLLECLASNPGSYQQALLFDGQTTNIFLGPSRIQFLNSAEVRVYWHFGRGLKVSFPQCQSPYPSEQLVDALLDIRLTLTVCVSSLLDCVHGISFPPPLLGSQNYDFFTPTVVQENLAPDGTSPTASIVYFGVDFPILHLFNQEYSISVSTLSTDCAILFCCSSPRMEHHVSTLSPSLIQSFWNPPVSPPSSTPHSMNRPIISWSICSWELRPAFQPFVSCRR